LDLNLRKKLMKWCIWYIVLCGTETGTLRKINQKYLESFEMWCWWRIETICFTDRVKKSKYCVESRKKRTFCKKYSIQPRKANWICRVVRRKWLLKLIVEEKIELTGRRWRRRKQQPDDVKEKKIY
jgi:hypothetical protein